MPPGDHHAPPREPLPIVPARFNRPLEDWAKLIGDAPAATAILDRFLQHAAIISITGKSYRLRHGGKQDSKGRPSAGEKNNSPPEDTNASPAADSSGTVGPIAEATLSESR
jgi:IstB-like ATP binding protein